MKNTIQLKISLRLLLLCFCSNIAIAQTRYLDSLDVLIREAKTDISRINLINIKTERLKEINLDSALTLIQKNLKAARAINYTSGEVNILTNVAGIYTTKGDYDTAKKSLERADSLVKLLKNERQKTLVYSALGILYGTQGKYDSANVYFKKLVLIQEKNGDSLSLGRAYANLAIGYQMQSNYPQTLFYQQKALNIQEAIKSEVSQSYLLMNMGVTYQLLQDTLRSEQSFLKGIRLANKNEIKNAALYGYSNLSALYSTQNKWTDAYDNARLASQLAKDMGDESMEAASMAKAAKALLNLDRVEEAEALVTKAIGIAELAAQPLVLFQTNSTKGEILTRNGRYREAIPFLEKSIHTLKDLDNYDINIAEAYANLSLCYENTGTYDRALINYKTSAKIKDSVRANENIRKATELSMNFDFEKKQNRAKAEQDIKDAQAKRSKNRQLYLILGLGILLLCGIVIALILFRNNKQKQKANLLLKRQKLKVEKALKELKTTQTQLIQSEKMASLGELTAGIAHEIQNPLNFVNNFSEVSNELIDEMSEEIEKGDLEEAKTIAKDIKDILKKINHHGKRADAIVKGMLQHSRTSSGNKEPTLLNNLANEYLRLAYHGLRAKDKSFNATLITDFDKSIGKVNIIPQEMGRVILNLITNAFYACNERSQLINTASGKGLLVLEDESGHKAYEPTVWLSTKRHTPAKGIHEIFISVKDNGNGIPKHILDKIFQPFFTTKPAGEGTGLGLSMSYDIITKGHKGEMKVATTEGEGTTMTIVIPVSV